MEYSEEFAAKLDRLLDTDDAHMPSTGKLERINLFLHSGKPALDIAPKLDRLLDTSALLPPSLPFFLEHARLPSAMQLAAIGAGVVCIHLRVIVIATLFYISASFWVMVVCFSAFVIAILFYIYISALFWLLVVCVSAPLVLMARAMQRLLFQPAISTEPPKTPLRRDTLRFAESVQDSLSTAA